MQDPTGISTLQIENVQTNYELMSLSHLSLAKRHTLLKIIGDIKKISKRRLQKVPTLEEYADTLYNQGQTGPSKHYTNWINASSYRLIRRIGEYPLNGNNVEQSLVDNVNYLNLFSRSCHNKFNLNIVTIDTCTFKSFDMHPNNVSLHPFLARTPAFVKEALKTTNLYQKYGIVAQLQKQYPMVCQYTYPRIFTIPVSPVPPVPPKVVKVVRVDSEAKVVMDCLKARMLASEGLSKGTNGGSGIPSAEMGAFKQPKVIPSFIPLKMVSPYPYPMGTGKGTGKGMGIKMVKSRQAKEILRWLGKTLFLAQNLYTNTAKIAQIIREKKGIKYSKFFAKTVDDLNNLDCLRFPSLKTHSMSGDPILALHLHIPYGLASFNNHRWYIKVNTLRCVSSLTGAHFKNLGPKIFLSFPTKSKNKNANNLQLIKEMSASIARPAPTKDCKNNLSRVLRAKTVSHERESFPLIRQDRKHSREHAPSMLTPKVTPKVVAYPALHAPLGMPSKGVTVRSKAAAPPLPRTVYKQANKPKLGKEVTLVKQAKGLPKGTTGTNAEKKIRSEIIKQQKGLKVLERTNILASITSTSIVPKHQVGIRVGSNLQSKSSQAINKQNGKNKLPLFSMANGLSTRKMFTHFNHSIYLYWLSQLPTTLQAQFSRTFDKAVKTNADIKASNLFVAPIKTSNDLTDKSSLERIQIFDKFHSRDSRSFDSPSLIPLLADSDQVTFFTGSREMSTPSTRLNLSHTSIPYVSASPFWGIPLFKKKENPKAIYNTSFSFFNEKSKPTFVPFRQLKGTFLHNSSTIIANLPATLASLSTCTTRGGYGGYGGNGGYAGYAGYAGTGVKMLGRETKAVEVANAKIPDTIGTTRVDKGQTIMVEEKAKAVSYGACLSTEGEIKQSPQQFYVFPGQLITYGDTLANNVVATESGQVLYVDSQKITLRRAQTVLIYSQAIIAVLSGEWIKKGTPLMSLSYQKLVTGDIVQGLPKIEQFFEAPMLKDGTFWGDSLQAKLNQFFQEERERLPLAEAVRKGFSEIQRVLVEGVQRVYISQGVLIADKHLEVIVRQMTCKGRILYSGDTGFLRNELVALDKIENVNQVTYGQKALYHPQVRGITDASLESESFLSAASFQETTRVLSRDAIVGKTDLMRGLKERVIVGELIQAGTGLANNTIYNLL